MRTRNAWTLCGHSDKWRELHYMTTVQEFFSTNEITGALTPEQAAQLLELPQGDTASAEKADPPVSAPDPEPSPASAEEANTTTTAEDLSADNAVILAKDGKHIIPFDKLSEARDSAQKAAEERDAALRRAAELQAQLDAAKPPAAEQPAQATETVDLAALRDERYEAIQIGDKARVLELEAQIESEIERRAEERITQRHAAKQAQEQAVAAADALQQAAESLRAKYPALDEKSASADPRAIRFVVGERDVLIAEGKAPAEALKQAVDAAASLFKWSDGQPTPTPRKSAAEVAAAAIAAAKQPVPATLSDIPGGKPAGQSFEAQLANKSGPEQLEAIQRAGWSREQIDSWLTRTL